MAGSDKTYIVKPVIFNPAKDIRKFCHSDCLPKTAGTDFLILAEDTFKVTAGEKDGSGAAAAADARFFSEMWGSPRNTRQKSGAAKTRTGL